MDNKIEFQTTPQPKGGMHQNIIDKESAQHFIGEIAKKLKEYADKGAEDFSINDFKRLEFLRSYFIYETPAKFLTSKLIGL